MRATFAQLAEKIKRCEGLVRALVMEAGVSIRPSPALPAAPEPETTEPIMWVGPPPPMARVQPEELDWSWQDAAAYNAELVVELYVQGRSYAEVETATGVPADDVRAMALVAGVARPHQVEQVNAAWRAAARAKLRKVCRMDLVLAWIDDIDVTVLADAHNVSADILWDLIADELARLNRRKLTVPPFGGHARSRPECAGIVCLYGCTWTCAATIRLSEPVDPYTRAQPGRSWPPQADLDDQLAFNDDGTVTWRWLGTPCDR